MRRLSVALLAGLVVTALAGCVGVPMSGTVHAGEPIDRDDRVQIVAQPSGPTTGASQEDILRGFIQAQTSPANDYNTAREFLAKSKRETWKPDDHVSIRDGSAGTPLATSGTTMQYLFSASAQVEADGRYVEDTEPLPRTLEFGFVKEGDEWRIDALDDGIVLSEESFANIFSSYPLYFFDPGFHYLVPDIRWFPTTSSVVTRVTAALVAGPATWLGQGVVVTALPPGTNLTAVDVVASTAVVDLSEEARAANDQQRGRMREQLSASLTNIAGVASVTITVDGVSLPIAGTSGTDGTFQPTVNPNPLVLQNGAFGFASASKVSPIAGISPAVAGLGALGGVYAIESRVAALRTPNGVFSVSASTQKAALVDSRPDLVDPTIDGSGYIYTVQSSKISTLRATNSEGAVQSIATSSLPSDARVISIDVSRDGTRMLVYLDAPSGPSLVVVGIVRSNARPTALANELISLPVDSATPVDATWENDRTVVAVAGEGVSSAITEFPIGGPSASLGSVDGATQIVGGNGEPGLRVLDSTGAMYKPSGSSWTSAGIRASFIATQQPG